MIARGSALLVAWTILMAAAPAQAQWFTNFCDSMCRNYKRNKDWPEPFLMPDRESVSYTHLTLPTKRIV